LVGTPKKKKIKTHLRGSFSPELVHGKNRTTTKYDMEAKPSETDDMEERIHWGGRREEGENLADESARPGNGFKKH